MLFFIGGVHDVVICKSIYLIVVCDGCDLPGWQFLPSVFVCIIVENCKTLLWNVSDAIGGGLLSANFFQKIPPAKNEAAWKKR